MRKAGYLVNKIANFEMMSGADVRKFMHICSGAVEPIRESAGAGA